jgi:hypothetical protein
MYREWKKTEFPRVLYMNLATTRFRGTPRNRWQDEVREDGRREECKKFLRLERNHHIPHMPME